MKPVNDYRFDLTSIKDVSSVSIHELGTAISRSTCNINSYEDFEQSHHALLALSGLLAAGQIAKVSAIKGGKVDEEMIYALGEAIKSSATNMLEDAQVANDELEELFNA